MASSLTVEWFAASGPLLCVALVLDLWIGDPVYPFHPVRVMGKALTWGESALRRLGFSGYVGGILLGIFLSTAGLAIYAAIGAVLHNLHPWAKTAWDLFLLYSLLALGDLIRHVLRVSSAPDDETARRELAKLVGRDVEPLDAQACRRAALESLAESTLDGVWSPLFWYLIAGIPGVILFKVASTMDSMVGYRIERYRQFGWFGARWDDAMNWIPARLSWLVISATAFLLPGFSGSKAFRLGWQQHGLLPSPNSGWPEAAMAGALNVRLVGPVYKEGNLVTSIWIGDPEDPPGADMRQIEKSVSFVLIATLPWIAAIFGFVLVLP